jgi:ABC-type glycerol-3-phosphate transport system substrate-binding protein
MKRMAAAIAATAALAAAAPASSGAATASQRVDIAFTWYWDGYGWVRERRHHCW